ncbi:MAG: glycosyltransferase family 4 protein, partial [Candidatus Neomarinimicrobiota bacterium]
MKAGTPTTLAILHYAGPPGVGGVETTIYHHARLLAQAGYDVRVIAGRGSQFHPQVSFTQIPELDSRHPDVLAVGEALAQGEVTPQFTALKDYLISKLRPLLSEVDLGVVHNAVTLHKNFPLTAALHALAEERAVCLIAWCHDLAWQDPLYIPDFHPGYPWDLLRIPWPAVTYVVVSQHSRKKLADLIGRDENEIKVINPGVDVADIFK